MSLKQFSKDWKSIKEIIFNPSRGHTLQERLENFYSGQASSYDSFRKKLLQGREDLFSRLSIQPGSVWVDFGAGTGSNLEVFGERLQDFKTVHLVDLSESLLKVAEQRIRKNNWRNVEIHQADCSKFDPKEPVDLASFSYSLSMMPNWYEALGQAESILKDSGQLAVVDYYLSRKHENSLRKHPWIKRHFLRAWFEKDNVFLNPDHIHYLQAKFQETSLEQKEAGLPYLGFLKVPYYQFVGKKKASSSVEKLTSKALA